MIPIYRAKKIDTNEYVEGHYYPAIKSLEYNDIINYSSDEGNYYISDMNDDELFRLEKIDLSTLEISFDNKNWYSIDEARRRINASHMVDVISE